MANWIADGHGREPELQVGIFPAHPVPFVGHHAPLSLGQPSAGRHSGQVVTRNTFVNKPITRINVSDEQLVTWWRFTSTTTASTSWIVASGGSVAAWIDFRPDGPWSMKAAASRSEPCPSASRSSASFAWLKQRPRFVQCSSRCQGHVTRDSGQITGPQIADCWLDVIRFGH